MAFDDLSKKQQKEILKIADKKIEINNAVKAYNKKAYKAMKADFKKFLSRNGEFTETQVPTNTLKYKKKKVARVQVTSGQFIERCMITMENQCQLSITRPQQVYGSNPNIFDVSPRKPNGELDTTMLDPSQINQDILSGQSIKDINKHLTTIGAIDPNAASKKEDAEDNA